MLLVQDILPTGGSGGHLGDESRLDQFIEAVWGTPPRSEPSLNGLAHFIERGFLDDGGWPGGWGSGRGCGLFFCRRRSFRRCWFGWRGRLNRLFPTSGQADGANEDQYGTHIGRDLCAYCRSHIASGWPFEYCIPVWLGFINSACPSTKPTGARLLCRATIRTASVRAKKPSDGTLM